MTNWGPALRRELAQRAKRFAVAHNITHYESCGFPPTILFPSDPASLRHGNFIDDSYAAILENPTWAKRLEKAHPRHDALPEDRRDDARELDSSNSSDALLMNCFCYPGAATRIFQSFLPSLPTGPSELLEFGVAGKVPLLNGKCDKTELDMRAGTVVFESKLTESHFYEASAGKLERYRDLYTVFDITAFSQTDDTYQGYQLIRNILAAAVHDYHFCASLQRPPARSLAPLAASAWGHPGSRSSSTNSPLALAASGGRVSEWGAPSFLGHGLGGESDVTRRWGYGSVEAGEGSWVGADGGSPEGDRSRHRRGGDGVGGLGSRPAVEREPETGRGVAAALRRAARRGFA